VFGSLDGVEVVVMQGRIHAYEDHSMWKVLVLAGLYLLLCAVCLIKIKTLAIIQQKCEI